MNRRLQRVAVLAMVAWSSMAFAQPFDYLGYKMLNTRDSPFRYYLDARAIAPAGIALSEVERATTAAFQTWENVACAYPDFDYQGYSTSNSAIADVRDTSDAFNVAAIWVTATNDPYYATALAGGRSSSATVPLTYAGYLYQCDIFLNAVNFRWTTLASTDPRENFLDLQTALTHEVGHCLGFADTVFPTSAVMNPDVPPGTSKRVLDATDVQQICEFYPEDGAVGSPCSPSDPCTNGLSCVPFTAQDGTTVLYRYCTQGCTGTTNGECPSPFACQPSSLVSGRTHACLAVPNQAVTQVGKPCNNNPECGSATGLCQTPAGLPSGGTAWVDGYCQQPCNAGSSVNACPSGSVCVDTDPQGTNDRCLKRCRPGTADCRAGYTCSPLAEGDACVPSCYSDSDCNAPSRNDFSCRICDRVCTPNKQTGLSVGDPCTTTEQCGRDQVCLFINNHPRGICAQPCSTAACGCPTGTTCKQVGQDRMCMKDCAAGTCATPAQCNPVGSTYSCTADCRTRMDCPTGFECYPQGCMDPNQIPDAGCTLCSDAGPPPPPPPPVDGGTGGGGQPGGCGCGSAPASAMLLAALSLLLVAGGRRSWRRQ
ncbi:adhesin [Hyalangium sp.]|uniref:adhesin n=1 Tax=Hyalangium sp. TaxID=2028555 RepID=UPI002D6C149A|nr:adhesin [Hyalangium sp.]HYI02753.1 adhesin [Hyalangium sp.]